MFLLDDVVYKIEKPKRLSFLDFSSIVLRRHFCHQEVRLNRRLAPGVYLGVVPIHRKRCHGRISSRILASADEEVSGEVFGLGREDGPASRRSYPR